MAINASPLVRTIPRSTLRTTLCNTPLSRFYASSTSQSSQVSDPASSSPESQAINKSRGLKGRRPDIADTRSTQSPVSPSHQREVASETHEGEEPASSEEQIKNDPSMSTEDKRRNVEKVGQKPLGREDR
ncbi:unnamed protein product [Penicillium egyptiacum]|uniref:Uncharacterized protein n=1 Tax=Penicillium egyptiacum TaxID=1303716 RepID=A0A9W4P876_9EURO|nr:unnamed protein product [Penicillium egyptiacum]